MRKNTRINVALTLSFGYLIAMQLIGSYLPSWLRWLAFPTFLIEGTYIFAGLIAGLLSLTIGAAIFTVLFYWIIGFFVQPAPQSDAP